MAITLTQLDDLLNDWQQKLGSISQNLYELYDMVTYQRLTGSGGLPQVRLTGQTQQIVSGALADFNWLFQAFELLRSTIDEAKALRDQVPRFGKQDDKINEVVTFLGSASIALPAETGSLAQRDLAVRDQPFTKMTPIELLNSMSQTFQRSVSIVFQVDAAWNQLEPKLLTLYDRTRPIETQIQQLTQHNPAALPPQMQQQLEQVRSKIQQIQDLVESDPLSAQQTLLGTIEPELDALTQQLDDLHQSRGKIADLLRQAQADWKTFADLHQSSIAKLQETREKVGDQPGLRSPLSDTHGNGSIGFNNLFNRAILRPFKLGSRNGAFNLIMPCKVKQLRSPSTNSL